MSYTVLATPVHSADAVQHHRCTTRSTSTLQGTEDRCIFHYGVDFNGGGTAKWVINRRDITTLSPGAWLSGACVCWFVVRAAAQMHARTGLDVRVIDSIVLQIAFDSLPECPRWLPPSQVLAADVLMIPWHYLGHWSLLILCHPGVPPLLEIVPLWQRRRCNYDVYHL